MANFAIVQQAARTSTGTQDWIDSSIPNFVAALFASTAAAANDTVTAAGKCVLGATDGVHDYGAGFAIQDASATPNSQLGGYADSILNLASGGGATWAAVKSALPANGVTENYTAATTSPPLISSLLIGGADIEVGVGEVALSTSATTGSIAHGCTAAPTAFMLLVNTGQATINSNGGTDVTWGFYESVVGTGGGVGFRQVHATVPTDVSQIITTDLGHAISVTNTDLATFSLSGIGASSLTLNRSSTGSTAAVAILISFRAKSSTLYAKAGVFTNPTSTGSFSPVSGLGVAPQLLLTVSTRNTVSGSVVTDDTAGSFSLGIACKTVSGSIQQTTLSMTTKDNVSTSVAKSQSSLNKAMAVLDNTGALQFAATVTSFNTDGSITMNCSQNTGGIAAKTAYLMLGMSSVKVIDGSSFTGGMEDLTGGM